MFALMYMHVQGYLKVQYTGRYLNEFSTCSATYKIYFTYADYMRKLIQPKGMY